MSRIGNNPISIPEGVSVNVNNNVITVNGKNGEMSQVFDGVSFDISDNTILVKRNSESKDHKSKRIIQVTSCKYGNRSFRRFYKRT